MSKFAQGIFVPKNPEKYIGKSQIRYRSSWELVFCQFCDNNKNIVNWASESIHIPYKNPLTGKQTIYIPDFLVVYENKHGQRVSELVEIKPKSQTMIAEGQRVSAKNRAVIAVNHAKWAAANAFCRRVGITFRVINENDIFQNGKRK